MQVQLDGSAAVGGIKEALMFPGCGDFQPLDYVQGLAKAFEKHGGRIYENTRVMNTDKSYVRALPTIHAMVCHRDSDIFRHPVPTHMPSGCLKAMENMKSPASYTWTGSSDRLS